MAFGIECGFRVRTRSPICVYGLIFRCTTLVVVVFLQTILVKYRARLRCSVPRIECRRITPRMLLVLWASCLRVRVVICTGWITASPVRLSTVSSILNGVADPCVGCHCIRSSTAPITQLAMSEKRCERLTSGNRPKTVGNGHDQSMLPAARFIAYAHRAGGVRPTGRVDSRNILSAEVVLQAVRIGDLGITAMPNEVYGITGLKLKRQSPLESDLQS